MLELVVARYTEDLRWLRRVPREFRVTVYDKHPDEPYPGSVRLPNVGRESHTYFWHLAQRYDSLAPLTVFCQGRPFDHAYDFHTTLKELAAAPEGRAAFQWLGHIVDTDDNRGRRLFVPWSKNPAGHELDIDGFHRQLFGRPGPATYTFRLGAQFAVAGDLARGRSRQFWERAAELAAQFPEGPHCLERMWDRVFGVEGLPAEWAGQTLYLKPVKRLLAAGPDGAAAGPLNGQS